MLFRRSCVGVALLAASLAACTSAPLPEAVSSPDPANPEAPTIDQPYRPVMAGTAAHQPAELKPWRALNEEVAPRSGRSP
jgi:hypothetical protein